MAAKFVSEKNLKFLLHDVFNATQLTSYGEYSQHNKKMFDMVLGEGLKLAKDKFWPILEEMDQKEPELVSETVKVHSGVRDIMKECGNGGWIGASFPEEYDGEQLPLMIVNSIKFMFMASNYSASVYPELTAGAAALITTFGSDELIQKYVPNMLSGDWQGTMALTEPDAGCSLADITTIAVPQKDGTYRIKGQKIFITAGDHDGVDNIVHLMLARIEGAPLGVKGISLFLVPKKRICSLKNLVSNDIVVSQIYHKLGYRGAPITELIMGENDDCHGYLVGPENKGLSCMFQMMNEARLAVGIGATGIASAAYYSALEYTRSRTQGRKAGEKNPKSNPVPIIEHADIKRMLLLQKAIVEGSLSLLLQCSKYADLEKVLEGEEKEKNALLLDLLTPVAKSYPSEMGIQSTSLAIQCFGGYGYCCDFPVEQYYRDARIHPIHEGTTGIQGMDLLGRKVMMQKGKALELFFEEVNYTIKAARDKSEFSEYAEQLDSAKEKLREITIMKAEQLANSGAEAFLMDATIYLEYFGLITIGWQWLKQALVANELLKTEKHSQAEFLKGKLFTFKYYFSYELPKINGLSVTLMKKDTVTVEMSTPLFND